MLIKGSCQKQNLMQVIHDAILSPGSNWTEISSNKTNDFKYSGTMTDGWVFESPPIGSKQQRIFLTLKSTNFSQVNTWGTVYMWLADNYVPNATSGQNGTYTNKSATVISGILDYYRVDPTTSFDYFIDVLDHRILIVVQQTSITTTTHPSWIYIGYPELNTNLEGPNYTNQFILGNIIGWSPTISHVYWRKNSAGVYDQYALAKCNLNNSNPTPIGAYLLSPAYITGDSCSAGDPGPLGVLTGIYFMPNTNIINGDIITIGADTYQVFITSTINNKTNLGTGNIYYYCDLPVVIAIKTNS
ncbi:hypothetical protein KM803_15885 [Clostridium tyrobutyricum]|uniref:hypothetical protein n=1 Tax=Clostridium tyrobutyricum TaxID=1519 RepID=UPI001C38820A|nr:hypothetical protein [Clostridium tyrobutyricum]MBV4432781.1 hypothetical protein [Clostridium tyrobutyricum]